MAKHSVSNYDRPGTGFGDRRVSGAGPADAAITRYERIYPNDAPEPESPPLILPVVVEDSSVAPVEELIELGPPAMCSSLPPPPGFSPYSWPVNDGGNDVDELCARIGVSRMCIDVSDLTVSPGVGVFVSPIIGGSSDMVPAVSHEELMLPPVDNCFVKDMLWAPAASQDKRPNDDREIPVPRWRLAREGPFLTEHSPESIRSWGPGAHSDTRHIAPRTMLRQWGTMAYPFTTRG